MKQKETDLITVVVPCFNVEQYVEKCVNSILMQTYSNLEIILVDDGSRDGTREKLDAFHDQRIIVIHQKNMGLSGARNTGIKYANGRYICFIDGDDYVEPEYVGRMYESCKKNKTDICVCGFNYVNEEYRVIGKKYVKNKFRYDKISSIKDILSRKPKTTVVAWNKLYRTDLFTKNNILYPVGRLHEDGFIIYKLYYYANGISVISDTLYNYLQRSDSIMNKKYSHKHVEDGIKSVEEAKSFLSSKPIRKKISNEIKAYEINTKSYILYLIIKNKLVISEKSEIICFLLKNTKEVLKNRQVSMKAKIMLAMAYVVRWKYE